MPSGIATSWSPKSSPTRCDSTAANGAGGSRRSGGGSGGGFGRGGGGLGGSFLAMRSPPVAEGAVLLGPPLSTVGGTGISGLVDRPTNSFRATMLRAAPKGTLEENRYTSRRALATSLPALYKLHCSTHAALDRLESSQIDVRRAGMACASQAMQILGG